MIYIFIFILLFYIFLNYLLNFYKKKELFSNNLNEEKNVNKNFTIIYKTYKNDLEWFKFSLLSLKKFLDPTNIYEIIIYTHDIVYDDVYHILENLELKNFISYRIIPIYYNYHGYIKQMSVKANCYKDVQTEYIIILDSDLILKKNLNVKSLIREDGKIEWFYLKKEDDPNNSAFDIWKKVVEDCTKQEQNNYYMVNRFPFVFTKKSLEEAQNKFIELNDKDYDSYCLTRCINENIKIDESTISSFDKLSRIWTEFEYLGFFCHNYSNDYIFTSISYERDNDNTYFIQYWSHGGITNEIKNKIDQILQ
jgi:hypothetical protein